MTGDCVTIVEKRLIPRSDRFFLEYNEEFGVMTQSPVTHLKRRDVLVPQRKYREGWRLRGEQRRRMERGLKLYFGHLTVSDGRWPEGSARSALS